MQRQPRKVAAGLCAAVKLTENNKLLEVDGRARAIAGDANASVAVCQKVVPFANALLNYRLNTVSVRGQ